MKYYGVVSAGHEDTARAAEIILRDGGNAFDAVVAAHFAACVCEPVLASLGGGGFLLAHPAHGRDAVYDFFAQTPRTRRPAEEIDFRPIDADFGETIQVFHIGLGSVAAPGTVKGIFSIYRDLCSLPVARLVEPAIMMAREGVTINAYQARIFKILKPILTASPEAMAIYASRAHPGGLLEMGEIFHAPDLADTLEQLVLEGERFFYEGEIAGLISTACRQNGGHLDRTDLASYESVKRIPLSLGYRGARILTNPPPSSGGILIGFALRLLEGLDIGQHEFGSAEHVGLLADVIDLTNRARVETHLEETGHPDGSRLLDPVFLKRYIREISGRAACLRGTTHMNVIDRHGNIAALTVSNGEGCGFILPGTGIMLNNMLGEEDLNPGGFHLWPENQRMTSMMAPTALFLPDHRRIALGSGGSNRLRTAILQVILNLVDFGLSLKEAVARPRVHYENGLLSVEGGFDLSRIKPLLERFPGHHLWNSTSMFFGGAHSAMIHAGRFEGAGDPRRAGVSITVT